MPGSAQSTGDPKFPSGGPIADFPRTVREIVAAFREIWQLAIDIANALERRRARKAAGHLDKLAFRPTGLRRPLLRIARGKGSFGDFDEVRTMLATMQSEVSDSLTRLAKYRDGLREKFGMEEAMKLDRIFLCAHDQGGVIHLLLMELVLMARVPSCSCEIQNLSYTNISIIHEQNAAICRMHDMILGIEDIAAFRE